MVSTINAVPLFAIAPLTPTQQQLWALGRTWLASPCFSLNISLLFVGDVDLQILQKSLRVLLQRQDALRTIFKEFDEVPYQLTLDEINCNIQIWDLEYINGEQSQRQAISAIGRSLHTEFDLTHGPLVRSDVIRLNRFRHILTTAIHHIIFDGWSGNIFVKELLAIYGALTKGREPELSQLNMRFGDFAKWQNNWLQSSEAAEQLAYWRETLKAHISDPEQSLRSNSRVSDFRYSSFRYHLAGSKYHLLMSFQKRSASTLFVCLVASLNALLKYCTGENNLRIAVDSANRPSLEMESIIGLLANTFVLCTDMSEDLTLEKLVHRVRMSVVESLENQSLPFEILLRNLKGARSSILMEAVQVLFSFQRAPSYKFNLPNLEVSVVTNDTKDEIEEVIASTFDLIFIWEERVDGAHLVVKYKSKLFDRNQIKEFVEAYVSVLGELGTCPGRKLSELDLAPRLLKIFE